MKRLKFRRLSSVLLTLISMLSMLSILSASAASPVLHFIQARFDNIGLDGAISVAVSPDDKHVYVASSDEEAVAVFKRNSQNGSLIPVEVVRNGVGPVDGLYGAWSVAVSPDGKHVYVAGRYASAVAAFSRDSSTGELEFLEAEKQGVGGVDGIDEPFGVGLSPDGEYVYVAGNLSNAIAWFKRDSSTGLLDWEGVIKDGDGGVVDGLDGVSSVVISPDGKHLYATSENDDAVATFNRNSGTGALTYVERKKDGELPVEGLDKAMGVTISPDGNHVYATGQNDDAVAVFRRDSSTGRLTFVEFEQDEHGVVSGMIMPQSVALSFNGLNVYVTAYWGLVCFNRNLSTGELTYASNIQEDDPGVFGLYGSHGVDVSQDDKNVYVAGRYGNAVVALNRNEFTGELTFNHEIQAIDGLDGAGGMAISPDGNFLYVTGNLDRSVVVLARNPSTGDLEYTGHRVVDGEPGVDGLNGARSIAISPDGKHAYVAGAGDNAVAVFARNATNGSLDFVEVEKDDFGGVDGLAEAQWVTISPDGNHVYVASPTDNAVAVFSRDLNSGELSYVENQKEGGLIDGLAGAYSVTVSPDGNDVYVTGFYDDSLVHFLRNPSNGRLTYDETYKDDVGMVMGLDGANAVVVSPDGNHVYVASRNENAVAFFIRNPSNGKLLYITDYQDIDPGLDGLNGARDLKLSPDGSYLYVASQWDDAVAVFLRDKRPANGLLTYLGMVQDGVDGVDGLNTANGIVISPDGLDVYVSGYDDDSVAAFARFMLYLSVVKNR